MKVINLKRTQFRLNILGNKNSDSLNIIQFKYLKLLRFKSKLAYFFTLKMNKVSMGLFDKDQAGFL